MADQYRSSVDGIDALQLPYSKQITEDRETREVFAWRTTYFVITREMMVAAAVEDGMRQ